MKLLKQQQYIDLKEQLDELKKVCISDQWNKPGVKVPKFYVKHLSIIIDTLNKSDPSQQKNKQERKALKNLKKLIKQKNVILCSKQITLFDKQPEFWEGSPSDLDIEDDDEEDGSEEESEVGGIGDILPGMDDEEQENIGDETVEDGGGGEDELGGDEDENEDDDWSETDEDEYDETEEDDVVDESEYEDDDDDEDNEEDEVKTAPVTTSGLPFDEETLKKMRNRSFWVKKKKKKQQKKKRRPDKGKGKTDKDKSKEIKDKQKESKGSKEKDRDKWTVSKVLMLFNDVLQSRGKAGVDRADITKKLERLLKQCELHESLQARLTIMSLLVSFFFDTAIRKAAGMSGNRWLKTHTLLKQIIKLLFNNPKYRMSEYADIKLQLKEEEKINKDDDQTKQLKFLAALEGKTVKDLEEKKANIATNFEVGVIDIHKKKLDPKFIWVHGNLWSYVKKLKDQLWVNLKSIAPKTPQYVTRLKHTMTMRKLLKKAFNYFKKLGDKNIQSDIYVAHISLIHNEYEERLDPLYSKIKRNPLLLRDYKDENDFEEFKYDDSDDEKEMFLRKDDDDIDEKKSLNYNGQQCILRLPKCHLVTLCEFVFENGDTRMQMESMLYLIFYLSLHNRFELSRDLLLMSHLGVQSRIGESSVELQILYNRALAQFALCAFKYGKWYSTMVILKELFGSGKFKVLLAQGIHSDDKNPHFEASKMRLLPYHLHINYDSLESAHLISSMFLEIPQMVVISSSSLYKRDVKNKYFRKIWDSYLRRDLRVPPENTQSIILTAGIHMQDGNWKKCIEKLRSLKVWNEIRHAKYIYKKIYDKTKLECMKCYLFKFGAVYVSVSFKKLSSMFNIEINTLKQFICKMIQSPKEQKFKASIDEVTDCLIIHQTPPTPLQRKALEYSSKLSYFIEQNEKILNISKNYQQSGMNEDEKKQDTNNRYKKNNKQLKNKFLPITNTIARGSRGSRGPRGEIRRGGNTMNRNVGNNKRTGWSGRGGNKKTSFAKSIGGRLNH